MKFTSLSFIILSALLITTSGCKKDADEPTASHLKFLIDFNVNGDSLVFNKVYDINGTKISFAAANFYMGGIKFTQANGDIIDLSNQYLLAGLKAGGTINEPLAISNITNVKFFIGVDSITNMMSESDFTNRPTGDPLGMQDPSMHWSWNTGYRFLRVDGKTDTDGDGTPETPVQYHLGNNNMLQNIDMSTNVNMEAGDNDMFIGFDLAKFFTGVDLTTELETHVGDNPALAQKIKNNLPATISIR